MTYFLDSVLPDGGLYCVAALTPDGMRQRFVRSTQEIMEHAEAASAQQLDSYFALATFRQRSRKAEHAEQLKAFFLDIDCGSNKPYPDVLSAVTALRDFIDTTGLPEPTIVSSGGGLHVYWPLTKPVAAAVWRPIATALKALCLTEGLRIDPTVTADVARVLRVPGTKNFKHPEVKEVQLVATGQPTDVAVFASKLPTPDAAPDLSKARVFGGHDNVTAALSLSNHAPSNFAKIVRISVRGKGCAQITNALANAADLEEPLWRAALSIAVNCADGEVAIHKLSDAHHEYTPAATTEKANRLVGKPYTCEWYRQHYPQNCAGCKHKLTSPIQLGAEVPAAAVSDGAYVAQAVVAPSNDQNLASEVVVEIPAYPYPYFRGANGGVYKEDRDEDGEKQHLEVYPHDLYVTGRFFDSDDQGDGDGEVVGLNLHLPHDGVRRFHATSVALLTKDKLRDTLVKYGVVAYGKQLDLIMSYLASSLRRLQSSAASNRTRSQMGWTPEGSFVVGELEYTVAGIKLAPPASGTRQLAPLFQSRGDIAEWSSVINYYGRPGLERHAFAFLVGMGSPLLQLLNSTQVRGAVLNLVSNASGTGKTTVQMAINSLFGDPRQLLMEAKDTPASRFQRLGTLNSICMTVDELTNATGEQLSALVYGSTSGRAPHRMEAQSNRLRVNNTTWCSITVTSSNAVMSDVLASHRSAVEGELKRVIDLHIPTPPASSKEETDRLFGKLADHFGVAGPIFIQHVVANRESVTKLLHDLQVKIDEEAKFSRSDRFYSAVLAVAFAAGMIGNKLGLFSWDMGRIYASTLQEIKSVKEVVATTTGDANAVGQDSLGRYISDNLMNALVISGLDPLAAPIQMPRGPLRMRFEPDTKLLIIAQSDLRTYFVERRVDVAAALQSFKARGWLQVDPTTGDLLQMRAPSAGALGSLKAPKVKCYVFHAAELGIDGLEFPDAKAAATR